MKIALLAVGKTTGGYIADGVADYLSRAAHYVTLERAFVPDIKGAKGAEPARRKILEGEALMAMIQPGDRVVLLDERGKMMGSREFAGMLQRGMVSGVKRMVFIVGGAFGFSDAVYSRADARLSLSPMTFPHDLVRLIFAEQLYRALTIMAGEKYHHD